MNVWPGLSQRDGPEEHGDDHRRALQHRFHHWSEKQLLVTDPNRRALAGNSNYAGTEGILPALESSHAVAHVLKLAPTLPKDKTIVVCLSGRGDKDIHTVANVLGVNLD